jgi:hypothetical protein
VQPACACVRSHLHMLEPSAVKWNFAEMIPSGMDKSQGYVVLLDRR